jgi:type IV pilus assembly protein PilE
MTTPTRANVQSHEGRERGFTLIELMITMAIVAILATIAYPAYRNYVLRGQVVSATNGLTTVAANMERYFQDNRTYLAANGFTPPCTTAATYGSFSVSCNGPSGSLAGTGLGYTLAAVGSGQTNGFVYTLDQTGTQGSAVAAPAPGAWILTCTSTWETKAGSC